MKTKPQRGKAAAIKPASEALRNASNCKAGAVSRGDFLLNKEDGDGNIVSRVTHSAASAAAKMVTIMAHPAVRAAMVGMIIARKVVATARNATRLKAPTSIHNSKGAPTWQT